MRYVATVLAAWTFITVLIGCAPHENYVSQKTIEEMPSRMENLKSGMTTPQILESLDAPKVRPMIGGGDQRNYHWSYPLREGCGLIFFYDLTSSKDAPIEVVLNTPAGNTDKKLQQK